MFYERITILETEVWGHVSYKQLLHFKMHGALPHTMADSVIYLTGWLNCMLEELSESAQKCQGLFSHSLYPAYVWLCGTFKAIAAAGFLPCLTGEPRS